MSNAIYIADQNNQVTHIQHHYAIGQHNIRLSNNVVHLNATGDAPTSKLGVQRIALGSNVTAIDSYSFCGSTNLKSATFNNGLVVVGDYAFYGCTSLQQALLPQSIREVKPFAFANCTSMSIAVFPQYPVVYGESSFQDCRALQSIDITVNSSSQRRIFTSCTSLQSAVIHGSLTDEMFSWCTRLTNCTLDGATSIPYACFYNASSLASITLPSTVARIGEDAFRECASLASINMSQANLAYIDSNFLWGTKVNELILPASIDVLEKMSPSMLCNSQVNAIRFTGMSYQYIVDNRSRFTDFGRGSAITMYAADGRKVETDSSGSGLQNELIYVISIGLADSTHDPERILKGAPKDIQTFNAMFDQSGAANGTTVIYRKFSDPNSTIQDAEYGSYSNIKACLEDAISKNPSLLIFHYSNHGTSSGLICTYDRYMYNTELYSYFCQFKRVFAVMCCCYPWKGVDGGTVVAAKGPSANIDDEEESGNSFADGFIQYMHNKKSNNMLKASVVDPKVLIWCAGKSTQKTWSNGNGTFFMLNLKNIYSPNVSYASMWETGRNSKGWTRGGREDGVYMDATPQKVNYNNFDETEVMFT